MFLCHILCPLNVLSMAEKQDIAMNQFQVASDVSYVYGETANGSQAKISKSDLNKALPGNLATSITLNKGESYNLNNISYRMIYVCEVAVVGAQALLSSAYSAVNKWQGHNLWEITDTEGKLCLFCTEPGKFALKNNYQNGCTFRVYML